MPNQETDRLKKLIALKKYEQPDNSFFDDFVADFRERQRAELLKRSSFELLIDRVQTWISSFASPKYAYLGLAALGLLVASVVIILPKTKNGNPPLAAKQESKPKNINAASYIHADMLSEEHLPVTPVIASYYGHEDMLAADEKMPSVMQTF